ncbi:hypothetical protein BC831DRAFT_442702 [Entophlyctis helioformis]|nr:hypothetical protein BC831DRAFT_442702 [Entophlyctis helioformis]
MHRRSSGGSVPNTGSAGPSAQQPAASSHSKQPQPQPHAHRRPRPAAAVTLADMIVTAVAERQQQPAILARARAELPPSATASRHSAATQRPPPSQQPPLPPPAPARFRGFQPLVAKPKKLSRVKQTVVEQRQRSSTLAVSSQTNADDPQGLHSDELLAGDHTDASSMDGLANTLDELDAGQQEDQLPTTETADRDTEPASVLTHLEAWTDDARGVWIPPHPQLQLQHLIEPELAEAASQECPQHVQLALQRIEPRDRRECRGYVSQLVTPDFEALVTQFLAMVCSAHAKMQRLKPLKAKSHRRIVNGLREVGRAVRSRKAKMVIVAVNIEPGPGNKGLDAVTSEVLDMARRANVPLVFAHSRRSLAKTGLSQMAGISNAVSCVAVLNPEGFEPTFQKLLTKAQRLRVAWRDAFCMRMPSMTHPRNETPLWVAAWYGACDGQVVRQCVANGWSLDEPDAVGGETPLMVAVAHGFVSNATALLDAGADVMLKSFAGSTVLHVAAKTAQERGPRVAGALKLALSDASVNASRSAASGASVNASRHNKQLQSQHQQPAMDDAEQQAREEEGQDAVVVIVRAILCRMAPAMRQRLVGMRDYAGKQALDLCLVANDAPQQ